MPLVFKVVSTSVSDVERRVRLASRVLMHEQKLLARILPDIREVLDGGHDSGGGPAQPAGDLSRWMLEPKAGIFLGRMTARIRDELWKKATTGSKDGACFQAWSSPNEQGFAFRTHGDLSRQMIEIEAEQGQQLEKLASNGDLSRQMIEIEGLSLVSLTKAPH